MIAAGRLLRDPRGGAGVLIAAAMPVLIGMGALAVDMGSVQLDSRRIQGIADAAAIAAATNPDNAQAAAEAVATAAWARPLTVRVTTGRYVADPAVAAGSRFVAGGAGADAARVEIDGQSPTFLARIFGRRSVDITRRATAARQRLAAFSIGSRLASLDGGLLNAYLGALTGSSLSLSVMDYQSLAGADVDLFGYLTLLKTSAQLDAVTFDDVLNSQVTTPQALTALAAALRAQCNLDAAGVIATLANSAAGQSLSLRTLIDAGPLATAASGGTGLVKVDGLAFATALLQLASPSRQVALDLGAGVPGLASTRVSLAIGEREQNSPWIAISAAGTPVVRTAQARLYVRTRVEATGLDGLSGLVKINLPILVELAAGEGRLNAIDCASATSRGVTLDARTDIGSAAIGTIDETQLGNFSTALTPSEATLLQMLLLLEVKGKSRVSLGAAEPWQTVRFSQDEIARGARKTVRSSTPVAGVATSLLTNAELRLTPLPLPLSPILRSVGGALTTVAPTLDSLLMLATGTLGVGLGEADLRVTGMRCGTAALVA